MAGGILSRTTGMAVLLLIAMPTVAVAFHDYSYSQESSPVRITNGVRVTRVDNEVTHSPGSFCNIIGAGNPVYETQWVLLGGTSNWIELATVDQCDDVDYLLYAYGSGGVFHVVGTIMNFPGGNAVHNFEIIREGSSTWRYKVDGVVKGSLIWSRAGTFVQAGLESYDQGAVTAQVYDDLMFYNSANQSWWWFDGQDNQNVGPNMCGHWNGATEWHAGEGAPC